MKPRWGARTIVSVLSAVGTVVGSVVGSAAAARTLPGYLAPLVVIWVLVLATIVVLVWAYVQIVPARGERVVQKRIGDWLRILPTWVIGRGPTGRSLTRVELDEIPRQQALAIQNIRGTSTAPVLPLAEPPAPGDKPAPARGPTPDPAGA